MAKQFSMQLGWFFNWKSDFMFYHTCNSAEIHKTHLLFYLSTLSFVLIWEEEWTKTHLEDHFGKHYYFLRLLVPIWASFLLMNVEKWHFYLQSSIMIWKLNDKSNHLPKSNDRFWQILLWYNCKKKYSYGQFCHFEWDSTFYIHLVPI